MWVRRAAKADTPWRLGCWAVGWASSGARIRVVFGLMLPRAEIQKRGDVCLAGVEGWSLYLKGADNERRSLFVQREASVQRYGASVSELVEDRRLSRSRVVDVGVPVVGTEGRRSIEGLK